MRPGLPRAGSYDEAGPEGFPEGVQVLVDNAVAVGNITRFAQNRGYQVEDAVSGEIHTLTIKK